MRRRAQWWNRMETGAAVLCAATLLTVSPARADSGRTSQVSDRTISDAVEDELLIDEAVMLNNIDVSTANGITTLTGHVNNALSRERAARIASTVKGVRSVINEIKVKPSGDRTDKDIQQDVMDALLLDPATESYEIDLETQDGYVTLSGTVDSWQERALAEKVAKSTRGVRGIVNEIRVSMKQNRSDQEIKPEIEERLDWDVLVDDALIDVSVSDGHVRLSGTAGSAAEKNRAELDAWVAGVKSVKSDGLKVRRWARDEDRRKTEHPTRSDAQIREAIEDALLWDARVNSLNVSAEVSNGVVTLRGKVDNLKASRAAAADARNTTGVLAVRNRLRIRSDLLITDDEIARNVRQALQRDPYVEKYQVTVTADGGVVELDGDVDSYFERGQADDVASRVNGVIAVDNDLTVDDELYVADPYVDDWYVYDYDWYDYEPHYTLMKSDQAIERQIEDELWWSPFVDSEEINVSVAGGVATLTGTVESASDRRIAAENALEGGATDVRNHLLVQ